jgi:hypothetical protein
MSNFNIRDLEFKKHKDQKQKKNRLSFYESIQNQDKREYRAIFMVVEVGFMVVQEIKKGHYEEKQPGQEKGERSE